MGEMLPDEERDQFTRIRWDRRNVGNLMIDRHDLGDAGVRGEVGSPNPRGI